MIHPVTRYYVDVSRIKKVEPSAIFLRNLPKNKFNKNLNVWVGRKLSQFLAT